MASPRLKVKQRSEAKESRGGNDSSPAHPPSQPQGEGDSQATPCLSRGRRSHHRAQQARGRLFPTHPAHPDLRPASGLPARDPEQAAAARRVKGCQAARGAGASPQPVWQMLEPPAISLWQGWTLPQEGAMRTASGARHTTRASTPVPEPGALPSRAYTGLLSRAARSPYTQGRSKGCTDPGAGRALSSHAARHARGSSMQWWGTGLLADPPSPGKPEISFP